MPNHPSANFPNVTILYMNIRSLRCNFDELRIFIESFSNKPDIIALTETWLTENDSLPSFSIDGFITPIVKNRSTRGGGVALYIKNSLSHRSIEVNEGECKGCEISLRHNEKFKIFVAYNPPSDNKAAFMNNLEAVISRNSENSNFLLVCDSNIDMSVIGNAHKEAFLNLIDSYGLSLHTSNLITRRTSTTASAIDQVFSNMNASVQIIENCITDHYPIVIELPVGINQETKTRSCRNIRFLDKVENHCEFLKILQIKFLEIDFQTNDVDSLATKIVQVICQTLDELMPATLRKYKDKKCGWINNSIKSEIAKRDKLSREYIRNPDESKRSRFNSQRAKVKKLIKTSKQKFYQGIIDNDKSSNGLFRVFNSLQGKNLTKKKGMEPSIDNANKLNDFFASIGLVIDEQIENRTDPKLPEAQLNSMFFHPVTQDEVSKCILSLTSKPTEGYDGINTIIIKAAEPILSYYLFLLLSKCLELGRFPDCFKISKIKPLHKDGNIDECSNYRPISLLPCLSKVFERIIYNRIVCYFNKYSLFNVNQFGFRKNHSTIEAIAAAVHHIQLSFEKSKTELGCFLDLRKAFDTVNHNILLLKMEKYGIRGPTLKLMKSYLRERQQFVELEDFTSSLKPILCGVPQGSILGPLLFLIYINDIHVDSNDSKILLFADDTCLIRQNASLDDFNSDLNEIKTWLDGNRLALNVSKTNYVAFSKSRKSISGINIGQQALNQTTHVKYLGILIDERLLFIDHIKYVCKRISSYCGVLFRIRAIFHRKQLLCFYNVYVKPIIQYGILVYGCTRKANLEKIWLMQKRIIRIIFYKKPWESITEHMVHNKIYSVFDLHAYELFKEIMKQKMGISNLNLLPCEDVTRTTRSNTLRTIKCPLFKTQRANLSLSNHLTKMYNYMNTFDIFPDNLDLFEENHSAINNFNHSVLDNIILGNKDLIHVLY